MLGEFDREETLSASYGSKRRINGNAPKRNENARSKETASQIDQIFQMMQMMRMYQTYQDFMKSNPNLSSSPQNSSNDDMFAKLMPLLMSQGQQKNPSPNNDFMNQLNQILNK